MCIRDSNWGFGLCYLFLRNVKGFVWNHKRVYRIYRLLELNLRIKPKRRLVREVPQPLAVPEAINQVWSMDCVFQVSRASISRQGGPLFHAWWADGLNDCETMWTV